MALNIFTTELKDIGKQEYLRSNFGYRYFFDVQNATIYQYPNLIKLKYVLNEISSKKVKKGELEDEQFLIDLGNIERRFNNLINVEKVNKVGSDKNIIQKGDIIIPKMQPQMGNIFLNLEHKKYISSTELLEYKISDEFKPRFIYYLITSVKFLSDLAKLESGKTHRRVNPIDLFKIKIPKIPKPIQDKVVDEIEPIEKKIKELKSQIKQPQEIINKVFAREFGFDENLYNEFGKGMTAGTQIAQNRKLRTFETDFKDFARSSIFRFSTRFHNLPTKELMDFMNNLKTLKVKDIIKEIIHRGTSPKYDQNGKIPVVKTSHLKNGYIEISEEEFVSEEFYNQKERSQVKKNDVLLASTGKVSLGKIDLVETDEKLVVDGHISIIRIDENKYNPLFFTYFFRSILGFFQIERDYTGATNQIELYASEIEKFLIPDISLTEQERIVNEIKIELNKQKAVEKEIEKERSKIDKIIEDIFI